MKLKLFSIAIATTFVLVGCNNNEEGMLDRNMDNDDTRVEQTRNNGDRNNRMNENTRTDRLSNRDDGMQDRKNNNNSNYSVSKEAADKISKDIPEIESAYVLTMDNNAYVAAVLDTNNKDTKKNGNMSKGDRNDRSNVNTRNISNDQNNTGEEVTDKVKKKVSDVVQSVDKNIDNVYVTTNPDFMDLTNDYINDMNDGKPIRGFFDQMGNMIERVFPQDKK